MAVRGAGGRFVKITDRDKGAKALIARVEKSAGPFTLTVGVHGEEGGASTGDGKSTVGEVATMNEFGLGVPERSFIRAWAEEADAQCKADLRALGLAITKGAVPDAQTGLDQLGLRFVGQIQARISSGIPPENAQSTVDKKGSSTPLINTGQLRSSVRHKVVAGEGES